MPASMKLDGDFRGFLAAVPISVVLWWIAWFAWLATLDGLAAAVRGIPAILLGTVWGGVWIALGAVIFLATPLWLLLEALDRVRLWSTLLGGALVGAVTFFLAARWMDTVLPLWMGAGIGLVTAACWWRISGRAAGVEP